jgi:hypothetical protein
LKFAAAQLQRRHRLLTARLSRLGLISQGSVQDRTRRKGGGAGYQWTRKVKGKTVTVSLSQEQFGRLKEAVANRRQLSKILHQLEKLSRQLIFEETPNPRRRKRLSQKVLGLI